MHTISLYGWNYTVWVDDSGIITHVECYKRYPKTEVRFIGDDWVVSQLQEKVNGQCQD